MNARGGKFCQSTALALAVMTALPIEAMADGASRNDEWDAPIVTALQEGPAGRLNTSQQAIELVVPVRERGPLGQVAITIGADDSLSIVGRDLIAILTRIVTPEAVASLQSQVDAQGFITPQGAQTVGFGLVFDTALLELAVTIPLEARQRQTLGLGFDAGQLGTTPTDNQQPFSAYINYRANLDYFHTTSSGNDEGFQAPRFDIDFNGTLGRVAFENLFTIDPDADNTFNRNASRLVYDQPDRALRWSLGDLIPEGTSFQNASDIAGVSVARLYSLQPNDRFITSRSSQSITLREPSTVQVVVNGAVARTLTLQPGTYDLRDLPLTQGANAVEIVIEGPSGAREVIPFDFFSDTTLLAPGVDEFYFSGGIRAPRDFDGIDYQEDDPIVSGFYRRGVNDQLTAGANLQATRDAVLAGVEAVYGSGLGITSVEFAASDNDLAGVGAAFRVEHRLTRQIANLSGREVYDFSLEAQTADFSPVENFNRGSNYVVEVAARYSRPLTQTISASIGGDYAMGRDQLEDRYGVSAFATWLVDFNTNVNFGVSYSSNIFEGNEANVFFNLTRRFGARSTFTASAESRDGRVSVGYSKAPERTLNDWAYNGVVTRTDDAVGLNGAALYATNRGDLEIDHSTTFDGDGDVADQRTALRAFGAVGFTGGRVGIGRRVFDSFALVRGHSSLGGRSVLIRGENAVEESARSGPLGPALVPLGSYYPQSIPYDVDDLPIGYDLGQGLFEVLPRYHSGYLLTVGSDYFVTATGILLNAGGQPLSLRSGRAVSLDDSDAPSPEVITNRVGRFAVSGLSAGRWRLTFQGSPALTYDIVVPADTLFRAGTLSPSGSGE